MINKFFENKGPFSLKKLLDEIKVDSSKIRDIKIYDIKNLSQATDKDVTFFSSAKYKNESNITKAAACITSQNLSKYLSSNCLKIIVKNVLFSVTKISKLYYPKADMDYPDLNLVNAHELKDKFKNIFFGKNVLIGKNVTLGDETYIGSNSIIESNVVIGTKCIIGSNVSIKNSLIGDNVHIQDTSTIGIKGFGFVPTQNQNLKTPHIGRVIIQSNVEIGAGCTIARGSLNDTVIGKNTFLDNQVHVAHNVKIGNNCMIAGQVGFAGSSNLGDNVVIGGQAGISGHLNINNNVSIGGGSGVIKDIPNNSKVMGYPAIPFKEFIKKWRKDVQ